MMMHRFFGGRAMSDFARRLVVLVGCWLIWGGIEGPAGAQSRPPVPEPAAETPQPVAGPGSASTPVPTSVPVPASVPAESVEPAAESASAPVPASAAVQPQEPIPAPVVEPPKPVVQPVGLLAEAIAARLASGLVPLDGLRPPDPGRLRQFYEARHYAAAWFSDAGSAGPALMPSVSVVRQVLANAESEGLSPLDYHPTAIQVRFGATDAARQAELDILLTDALMDYINDVHRGRLPPHVIAEEFALIPPTIDVVGTAVAALAAPDPAVFLAGMAPSQPSYIQLREILHKLRAVEQAGGWPRVPEGHSFSLGVKDPAVRVLRQRLAATGDLDARLPLTLVYDQAVKGAVQHFQARHGLEPNGLIHPETLMALNIGVSERITSIIANMERERWMPEDLGPRHVLVNIPGFDLKVIDNGTIALQMPVIVGTKIRRTPIFASSITSLILNPTWSVPTKLAREDILPKLRRDPNYLAEQHITLYDGSFSGGKVNPARIDWGTFTDINRFRLRQTPGIHNALGQVKFNIPNDFDVYLHDTPHREKFGKAVRTFSSGCVRVGQPIALADYLLADMPEWTPERRKQVLEKGETRMVTLHTPMPVYLLYRTAWVDAGGVVQFREDIYGRDAQVMHAIRRVSESVARSTGSAG